jgi:hypothetical protein
MKKPKPRGAQAVLCGAEWGADGTSPVFTNVSAGERKQGLFETSTEEGVSKLLTLASGEGGVRDGTWDPSVLGFPACAAPDCCGP